MKSKLKILLVLFSAALNVAFVGNWAVRAFPSSKHDAARTTSGDAVAAMPALYRHSGVTEQQWSRIEPKLDRFRSSALAVFERMTGLRRDLLALLASPQADRASIADKQKEIRAEQARIQELVASHILAEKEILTPAQRRRYFDLLGQGSGRLCEELMDGLRSPRTTEGDGSPVAPRR